MSSGDDDLLTGPLRDQPPTIGPTGIPLPTHLRPDVPPDHGLPPVLVPLVEPAAPQVPPVSGPGLDLAAPLRGAPQLMEVDLDLAPQAVVDYRHAAEFMRGLRREAERAAVISPPGLDGVSRNAVREMGEWAISDQPGSLSTAIEQGARRMEEAADAMEEQLRLVGRAEEINGLEPRRLEL